MPYLAGVLTGVLLTILVVFLVDNLAVASASSGTRATEDCQLGCSSSEAAFLYRPCGTGRA